MSSNARDRIFISYAWEDHVFAHWLANALLRCGYKVWIDRNMLLGGEAFDKEIEDGINNQSIRFLALMSKFSKDKQSPRRERNLASKAAKKLQLNDFIIPIRVDDLSPDDYDFITTEHTAIDFTQNWATSFRALLKKIEAVSIPKFVEQSLSDLSSLIDRGEDLKGDPETLYSNHVAIKSIPKKIHAYRYEDIPNVWKNLNDRRIYWGDSEFWTFIDEIHFDEKIYTPFKSLLWEGSGNIHGIIPRNVAVKLITSEIELHCIDRGMREDERMLYFPLEALDRDEIKYTTLTGRPSAIQSTGLRISSYYNGTPVRFRYYLGFNFRCVLDRFSEPFISLVMRIRVTDLNGRKFDPKKALSRRKKAIRSWYNKEWLARFLAFTHWLTKGTDLVILKTRSGDLKIAGELKEFQIPVGILDAKVKESLAADPFGDNEEVEV